MERRMTFSTIKSAVFMKTRKDKAVSLFVHKVKGYEKVDFKKEQQFLFLSKSTFHSKEIRQLLFFTHKRHFQSSYRPYMNTKNRRGDLPLTTQNFLTAQCRLAMTSIAQRQTRS